MQQIIEETAKEVAFWARDTGEAQDGELVGKLEEGGLAVNKTDRDAFVDASKPIYEKFAAEVEGGQEMIDQALSLANGSGS